MGGKKKNCCCVVAVYTRRISYLIITVSVSNNLFVLNILQLYHLKYGEILPGKWLVANLVLGVRSLRKACDDALVLLMSMAFWREEHSVPSSLTSFLRSCKLWVTSLSSYQLPLSFFDVTEEPFLQQPHL